MAPPNNRQRKPAAAKDKIATTAPSGVPVREAADTSNPIAVIVTALNAVMEAVFNVEKNGTNDFHGYSYTTEADLLARLRPEMVKQGLVLIPSTKRVDPIDQYGNVLIEVHYTLAHRSGAVWPDPIVAPGAGNDKAKNGNVGDKGLYKALTGANKYLLLKLFQIATGDDPETQDFGHQAPAPGARPEPARQQAQGQQSQGQQRPKPEYLSLKDQKAFEDDMAKWLDECRSADDVEKLMRRDDVVADLAKSPEKAANKIRLLATARFRELRPKQPPASAEPKPEEGHGDDTQMIDRTPDGPDYGQDDGDDTSGGDNPFD